MWEIRTSGLEGGGTLIGSPYPYLFKFNRIRKNQRGILLTPCMKCKTSLLQSEIQNLKSKISGYTATLISFPSTWTG